MFLAASGSLGRRLMARAPLVDERLWACHTARPSVALRQEAAAALASSTARTTGYLCKRGRQRWLVSESDASANFRGSNRPLSARRTPRLWLCKTRAKPNVVFEACIHPKGARRQRTESVGRSRVGAAVSVFWVLGQCKTASQEAVASTVDEPGLVSTHLDTAVAVRIESVAIEAA